MRKVILSMSVSLDGYIEAADGDLGWAAPDDELHRHFNDLEREQSLCFYGRRLYEIMAGYWPTADENPDASQVELDFAAIWKAEPKVVFSRTLKEVAWNATLATGDVASVVGELRRQPGGPMSVGGAELASSFMRLDLIDEYRLYVHPVVLGGGKPLFRDLPEPMALRLVETRTFGSGVVLLRYERSVTRP